MEKLREKVVEELAKSFDYVPGTVKSLEEFMDRIQDFSQYLANNQYYSEGLNKKVFLLNLDSDECTLKLEMLRLKADAYYREVEKSILRKEKPALEKKDFIELNKEIGEMQDMLKEIHARALKLTEEIRHEYKQKM